MYRKLCQILGSFPARSIWRRSDLVRAVSSVVRKTLCNALPGKCIASDYNNKPLIPSSVEPLILNLSENVRPHWPLQIIPQLRRLQLHLQNHADSDEYNPIVLSNEYLQSYRFNLSEIMVSVLGKCWWYQHSYLIIQFRWVVRCKKLLDLFQTRITWYWF